jgi:hypothetical protein
VNAAAAFPFTTSAAVGPANTTGYVYIHGITLIETGGSNSITVKIRDGGAVGGNIVAAFTLAAATGLSNGILPRIKVSNQCYVQVTGSGAAQGVLYVS